MSGHGMATEKHILELFKSQNRPFNVQVVTDFLAQFGIKKAQVQKTLDTLAENDKIAHKEFGKTKIFWPKQSNEDVLSKEELEIKKKELASLKEIAQNEIEELSQIQKEQSSLKTILSLEEIEAQMEEITKKKETLMQKLIVLRENSAVISAEDRQTAEKTLEKNVKCWEKWRVSFKEIWKDLSEGFDRKDDELFEEIGVERTENGMISLEEIKRLLPSKRRKLR